jgi:ABC-2 type transport system permease protein
VTTIWSHRAIGRLRTLMWREFAELIRDPGTILILIFLPLLLIAMISYALTIEVRHLPLGVFDADQSGPSRRLVGSLESTGYFDVIYLPSLTDLKGEMASTEISAALVIPSGFARNLALGRTAPVQAIFDGTETVISANAAGLIDATVAAFQRRLNEEDPRVVPIAQGFPPAAGLSPGETDQRGGNVQARPPGGDPAEAGRSGVYLSRARGAGSLRLVQRNLFNPAMDPTDFTIPGLVGFITTFLCIVTTALSIVRERQAGTFEQLRVTPVTSLEIIIGKIVPLGLVYLLDTLLLMGIGFFVFGIWPRGSVLLLLAITALFLLLNLSWGLLISAAAPSPDHALQTSVLIVIPQLALSGLVFPIHSMDRWARWLVELVPLAHYLRIIRGIYLKGAGLTDIWFETLILVVFLALFLVLVARSIERLKI